MEEPNYEALEVVGLHVPDYSLETNANGQKEQVELPGMYHIGVMVRGVFQPIYSRKAGGLFTKVERAQAAADAASTDAAATPAATGSGG